MENRPNKVESVTILKGKAIPDSLPASMVLKIEELKKALGENLELTDEENQMPKTVEKEVVKSAEVETTTISATDLADLQKSVADMETLKTELSCSREKYSLQQIWEYLPRMRSFCVFWDVL